MKEYQIKLAGLLADSQALFFKEGLTLKDGRPTPYFVNFGYFKTGRLIWELGEIMADYLVGEKLTDTFDVLVGPSYKGSSLAVATAAALWQKHGIIKGFDYDRKAAKTHGEASAQAALFVTGALYDGCRVMLIDDVVTTMGTKYDILAQLETEAHNRGHSYQTVGVILYMDREQTTAVYDQNGQPILGQKGGDAVKSFAEKTGIAVRSIGGIKSTVEHLAQSGRPVSQNGQMIPLSAETLDKFTAYIETYGV